MYAYSSPFRVFSAEGTRVARDLLVKLSKFANQTGRNITLRGIWHVSPFFRDLVTSDEFLGHMAKVFGEPVWPHFYLSNLCLNVGEVGSVSPAEQWHFDSVNYVGVMLLSDITDMEGGQLEILKRPKHIATDLLTRDSPIPEQDLLKVSYGEAGKCIAVQGEFKLFYLFKLILFFRFTPGPSCHAS